MNYLLLILNLTLGSVVLLTYIYFLPLLLKKKISLDEMWGNIKGRERNLTILSMIISAISFLYVIYYFTITKIKNKKLVYTAFIIFFIGAILWAPSLYNYFMNKNDLNLIIMILMLCLTTIGIILLTIYIFSLKKQYLLKLAISLFLFHVLFLDNLNYASRFIEN